ncbi:MAG: hypothetical protein C6W57_00735 [Caldibacillus debilis]|jgi:hypothetical protein|uniref:Uncharacterized protein n=1 Tax=Caldibacillus debilis TaxID=301148 RepID=A0A150L8M0_9BACI|nr:hypothetical protein [Caldibacillus debilis]MBO2483142.1 hypothetical protein [Bacillaceae bacterium]KYD08052.1 hypothetical protein B4135_4209 [Caldibacillus debilis]OUM91329.1 MAG: hypothetical protein BAA03_04810 [Caldibacillus debilis]REJ19917.1 MAG: hypothetical protein C6W57_00735 [Caldibacillus debilis]REJ30764.1 MAG: hypothetical protein C6W56_02135 [Caldibacillus debilis]
MKRKGCSVPRIYFNALRYENKYSPEKIIKHENGEIFIGPSVEGKDQEYEKVLSGEVERRKPSFV